MSEESKEVLKGSVKHIVYRNEDTSYTVFHLEPETEKPDRFVKTAVVVGKVQAIWEGEDVTATGRWVTDKLHGRQFKAESIQCVAPRSLVGIERYLASGLIKGVGKVIASRIVQTFKHETLHVLSHQSGRLREVPKLGRAKIEQIRKSWRENETMRELYIFGQTYGISIARMTKIVRRYGPDAVAIIKANPYRLCKDIWGIGFSTADKIALSVGIPKDSILRARASITHTLETQASEAGHCWSYENELMLRGNELTEIPVEILHSALQAEIEDGFVAVSKDSGNVRRIYLNRLYYAEHRVAGRIKSIMQSGRSIRDIDAESAISWWESKSSMILAQQQREALANSLREKFSIITGGPGVGKTTIIRALAEVFKRYGANVVLAAPTGRAAKRMTESVGLPAQTIHRFLKWNPATNQFTFNIENRCKGDVFVFDETSMIDISLASELLSALPDEATVVFVGDTDQLPSVGPGSVLSDLIASNKIASVKLNVIFRQDSTGLIVKNAHHVNAGENLEVRSQDSDFYFIRCEDPEVCVKRVVELMSERIPRTFGFDPLEDIQVLTPMRRNLLGAENLNTELQKALNRSSEQVARGQTFFRRNDRVMQLRNNYDKEVFNGDIGKVLHVDVSDGSIVVEFDSRPVKYDSCDLDELVLAYATTIHKSQGSEYSAVVVVLHSQHYIMLQRNLLYTAITRGKKLVVVIGTAYALNQAIKTNTVRERRTTLAEILQQ
jgi:exodeoxyribonuclease V alpha subunit